MDVTRPNKATAHIFPDCFHDDWPTLAETLEIIASLVLRSSGTEIPHEGLSHLLSSEDVTMFHTWLANSKVLNWSVRREWYTD